LGVSQVFNPFFVDARSVYLPHIYSVDYNTHIVKGFFKEMTGAMRDLRPGLSTGRSWYPPRLGAWWETGFAAWT
jgi:hypothetical protein